MFQICSYFDGNLVKVVANNVYCNFFNLKGQILIKLIFSEKVTKLEKKSHIFLTHAPPTTTTDIKKHARLQLLRPFQTASTAQEIKVFSFYWMDSSSKNGKWQS